MMNSSGPKAFGIHQIYVRYCDIVSQNDPATARELLSLLSCTVESQGHSRDVILSELSKLMSCLNFSVDSHQFSCFYDFIFFMCRENGQKNITVKRAITAWGLVLSGRFRLLNQWCSFLEENQRHNISADIWQQVLAFSRCVNEDLDGYDPKGAWPVLIDDFVEHMYRVNQSSSCSTELYCSCGNMQAEPVMSSAFRGLNLLPGSKRKLLSEETEGFLINRSKFVCMKPKRLRQSFVPCRDGWWDSSLGTGLSDAEDISKHGPLGCAVEDSLAKGFEGHLSIGCCFQFEQKGRISYTSS